MATEIGDHIPKSLARTISVCFIYCIYCIKMTKVMETSLTEIKAKLKFTIKLSKLCPWMALETWKQTKYNETYFLKFVRLLMSFYKLLSKILVLQAIDGVRHLAIN